jgi:precorrin-2/cobalt-factor-2 C20-methyltransferase
MSLFKVVGLGPGDPELLTVKGYKAIMDADVVFYPKTSLNSAGNILNSLGVDKDHMKGLEFPIGSRKIQELSREYAKMIIDTAKNNIKSVYAVEGEPMLYSTFLDIMPYLTIDFDIIPGISSINGISSKMSIILATKDEPLLVLPAINDYNYMENKIMSYNNIVILKATRAKDVIKKIIENNGIKNYYIMSYVSTEKERIYNNIDDIMDYMTIVVIKRYT